MAKILVIEDDTDTAMIIERILIRAGYEVKVAHDGFAAGTLMSSFKPALVTLDLNIPGIDGYQVLNYIRNTDELAGTRVLVISSETEEGIRRAMDAGANSFLTKPFAHDMLVEKLKSIC